MRPLVLLDVDGVLNALGPADGAWPDWEVGAASALGRDWPIRWSPSVVSAVRSWRDTADVQWLTTWGAEANGSLRQVLGLPELPVAGTADEPPPATPPPSGAASALAAVTPAAPAPTGRWWKFDVVRRLVTADPLRPLVWLDDDLVAVDEIRAWTRARARCLLIAPEPRRGLVQPHLDAVRRFLTG